MSGVIASRPIEYLDEDIPQFIMKDTYSAIKKLGEFSFSLFKGKMIELLVPLVNLHVKLY